ncbi:MAG: LysR family transcriptional regulator [Pseudomonadota bacterium]
MATDRFAEIETLKAVADTGSFSKAAMALGITQSAVSRRIVALEARLGDRQLVARTTRQLQITTLGRRYLARAQSALELLEQAAADLDAEDSSPAGLLRLSLPPAFGRVVFMPALRMLSERYPRLRLDIDLSERYVEFAEDRIDLAVRVRAFEQSGTDLEKLANTPLLLLGAPAYLQAHCPDPRDLSRACLIDRLVRSEGDRTEPERRRRQLGITRSAQIRCADVTALRELAEDGHGLTILPALVARPAVRSGRLQALPTAAPLPVVTLYAQYPRELRALARGRALLQALRDSAQAAADETAS